jgi:hypothetical protein
MEQLLQQLDDKYAPLLEEAQTLFNTAQAQLSSIQGEKELKAQAIRDYYIALEAKKQAEAILSAGAPKI